MENGWRWGLAGILVTIATTVAAVGLSAAKLLTKTQGAWLAAGSLAALVIALLWVVNFGVWPILRKHPWATRALVIGGAILLAGLVTWHFWGVWVGVYRAGLGFVASYAWHMAWMAAGMALVYSIPRKDVAGTT